MAEPRLLKCSMIRHQVFNGQACFCLRNFRMRWHWIDFGNCIARVRQTQHHFSLEHEQAFVLYEDSYDALRSCSRLNPAWLEMAIAKANPATEPVHDLAYLVSGLNDDGAMWKRCKENLRAKVPVSKERSLALNILHYQDKDEIEWLLDRVSRADDLVGPVAFQALTRIDEGLALDHLTDVLELAVLYFTRHWCLPELLMRRPKRDS